MHAVLVGGMDGDFCWRQSENKPTVAQVDVRELQGIAQESAVSLGIRAVNNRMPASNHSCPRFQSVVVAARPQSTAEWQRGAAHREAFSLDRSYLLPQNTSGYATCPRHKRNVHPRVVL